MSQILLKGGTLLVHDKDDHVVPRKADVLIQDDRIAAIEDDISATPTMKVVDCTSDIVSPGFIDTHHHVWQSQQKGKHSDHILFDYYHSGNLASYHYTPDDIFWGELSGALEAVDAGTTTIVDHAHLNYSPEHSKQAIRATITSGIRSVFCYCVHPKVATWLPEFTLEKDWFPEWAMTTYADLAAKQPFGPNGRVRLGFAIDGAFVPAEILKNTLVKVRALGAHLITSHVTSVGMFDQLPTAVSLMAKNGLLGPDVLFSHANNTSSEELALLKTAGAHISSTPLTEMQMGHGYPICLQPDFFDISSLGIDCHSFCSASLPVQMLAILQSTRAKRFSDLMAMNQWDASVGPTVEDVYNLGTIKGARAIKLENQVGSLEVGKKADLVIFDKSTPSMRVVAERNPVASIVFHSSVRDIKMVIIDGVIRKEQFKLTPLRICKDIYDENENENEVCQEPLDWEGVGQKIDQSYKEMEARITETVDEEVARDGLIKGFLEMLGSIASN